MKIGFIGSGNMGGAIARGIVKSGVVEGKDVYLYDVDPAASEALARDLRRRGMRFFGPTVAYAFLQAAGVINGHEPGCFLAPPGGAAGPK